jgi:galactokinase
MAPATFHEVFGFAAEALASAPGRVNLLGEHTDYNDGFVLPTALPLETCVETALSRDGANHFYAAELDERVSCPPQGPVPEGFAAYIHGCLCLLKEQGFQVAPVAVRVTSRVPMGAGLSSSAALEVAVLRAMRTLFRFDLDDVRIAQMAQQAEIRFAHVNCGIMDQMASSLADARHMLFLDTRSLERKILPLPEGGELLVLDCGVPRRLGESMYNQRREECEEASRILGVKALRDVDDLSLLSKLPDDLQKRARHVVTENRRVLEAAQGVDAVRFGELMNASHESLRDDYMVSIHPLDHLVQLLQDREEVFGARLTGAGFGGACVALVRTGNSRKVGEQVLELYREAGHNGKLLVAQ